MKIKVEPVCRMRVTFLIESTVVVCVVHCVTYWYPIVTVIIV